MPAMNRAACMALLTTAIAGCGGGGGSGHASYLVASVPEFYFGTRDVGSEVSQTIELANRSADIYPLHALHLKGDNAEEFSTSYLGGIELKPAEKISIDVSFNPITDGLKSAMLDIEYEIIPQATPEQNQNEQAYYAAAEAEQEQRFDDSAAQYKTYLKNKPVTQNLRRAALKLPVLKESDKQGSGPDFDLYLSAVNKRDSGDNTAALQAADALLRDHPDSYLADDAMYMRGYIQLMDMGDYRSAQKTMRNLRSTYPSTEYFDTALYSEGMAWTEMGDHATAAEVYTLLKDRHTSAGAKALSLDLPKDNIMSRMWFDRAKKGLQSSEQIL